MSVAPILIPGLSDDEDRAIRRLVVALESYSLANFEANAYYEAKKRLNYAGFNVPSDVAANLRPVSGAPAIVVDVLEERLDFLGWDTVEGEDLGLSDVYDANELDAEAPTAHIDALTFGTAFVRVGSRPDGGLPLVTLHSPMATTGVRDPVLRRMTSAWTSLKVEDGRTVQGVLDLPDVSITVALRQGRWTLVDRDEHGLGRVPCVQLINRGRSSRAGGRSEITPAIRSLTDNMMRATLGMGVNSLFYSIPQLMLLGRGEDAFKDRNGNPVPGWRILAGHALAIDKDDDGDKPDVKQLTIASPQPFIEQLREFRLAVAAEAGMPPDYMGIHTSNPSSADAITRGESRLVKRAERRQTGFGRGWQEVGRLSLLVRDGEIPPDFDQRIVSAWLPAQTPTRAAAADEIFKYVSAGVLAPDSAIVRKRLATNRAEERMLAAEQRRAAGNSAVRDLLRAAAGDEPGAGD